MWPISAHLCFYLAGFFTVIRDLRIIAVIRELAFFPTVNREFDFFLTVIRELSSFSYRDS